MDPFPSGVREARIGIYGAGKRMMAGSEPGRGTVLEDRARLTRMPVINSPREMGGGFN